MRQPKYTLSSGSLPAGLLLNEATGKISGKPTDSYSIGGVTSSFTIAANDGTNTTTKSFTIVRKWQDGSTAALAGTSAAAIKAETGINTDGVFYINLPTAGPTQTYCLMDRAANGGGWMMAFKATTGTTFSFSANYWNTANTLNTAQYNRNNGDAKFDIMNYYKATDIAALWPDITTNGGGFGTNPYGCWSWLENSFTSDLPGLKNDYPIPMTMIDFFGRNGGLGVGEFGTNNNGGKFVAPHSIWPGHGGQFSAQADIRFYGFNFRGWGGAGAVRWGFGFNENSEGQYWSPGYLGGGGAPGSNDVSGGIGMSYGVNYSAGDSYSCCGSAGINRSARVEVYVR